MNKKQMIGDEQCRHKLKLVSNQLNTQVEFTSSNQDTTTQGILIMSEACDKNTLETVAVKQQQQLLQTQTQQPQQCHKQQQQSPQLAPTHTSITITHSLSGGGSSTRATTTAVGPIQEPSTAAAHAAAGSKAQARCIFIDGKWRSDSIFCGHKRSVKHNNKQLQSTKSGHSTTIATNATATATTKSQAATSGLNCLAIDVPMLSTRRLVQNTRRLRAYLTATATGNNNSNSNNNNNNNNNDGNHTGSNNNKSKTKTKINSTTKPPKSVHTIASSSASSGSDSPQSASISSSPASGSPSSSLTTATTSTSSSSSSPSQQKHHQETTPTISSKSKQSIDNNNNHKRLANNRMLDKDHEFSILSSKNVTKRVASFELVNQLSNKHNHNNSNNNNGCDDNDTDNDQPHTYKLNPSSMFLRKAMRYYRVWIYCTNLAILFATITFIAAVAYVMSDYRMVLIMARDSGDTSSSSSLPPSSSLAPSSHVVGQTTAIDQRPIRVNFQNGIRLFEPSLVYAYIVIALQAGILQSIGCFGAIRMKERLLQAFWCLILLLFVGDILLGSVWIIRYNTIAQSIKANLRNKLRYEFGYLQLDPIFTQTLERIQSESRCCGISGPHDYRNSHWFLEANKTSSDYHERNYVPLVPASCCRQAHTIIHNNNNINNNRASTMNDDGLAYSAYYRSLRMDTQPTSDPYMTPSPHNDKYNLYEHEFSFQPHPESYRRSSSQQRDLHTNPQVLQHQQQKSTSTSTQGTLNQAQLLPVNELTAKTGAYDSIDSDNDDNELAVERIDNLNARHSMSLKRRLSAKAQNYGHPSHTRDKNEAEPVEIESDDMEVYESEHDDDERLRYKRQKHGIESRESIYERTVERLNQVHGGAAHIDGRTEKRTRRWLNYDEHQNMIDQDKSWQQKSTCQPSSYDQSQLIYTRGCYVPIIIWLRSSANILAVVGFCVLSFLKLCSICLLRYEIREMIRKIKTLKGLASEYNAIADLEQYLPRPSVCAQPAELTSNGVSVAGPTMLGGGSPILTAGSLTVPVSTGITGCDGTPALSQHQFVNFGPTNAFLQSNSGINGSNNSMTRRHTAVSVCVPASTVVSALMNRRGNPLIGHRMSVIGASPYHQHQHHFRQMHYSNNLVDNYSAIDRHHISASTNSLAIRPTQSALFLAPGGPSGYSNASEEASLYHRRPSALSASYAASAFNRQRLMSMGPCLQGQILNRDDHSQCESLQQPVKGLSASQASSPDNSCSSKNVFDMAQMDASTSQTQNSDVDANDNKKGTSNTSLYGEHKVNAR
ncbi:hypothetical protein GZH46_02061 [Fragariocoptes setiger]|uniref:Tetraspanin n=1 Tax=Fragariocoptes setiger TaxID=1670756 RepID=A0ABQ7S7M9_9ACAR|nr:hypothetical protein GZH46_02061 [Fragariocoptes setiger]